MTDAQPVPSLEVHASLQPADAREEAQETKFTRLPWQPLREHKQMRAFETIMQASDVPDRMREYIVDQVGQRVEVRLDRPPRHYQYKHPAFTKRMIAGIRRMKNPKCNADRFPDGKVETLLLVAWTFLFIMGIPAERWPPEQRSRHRHKRQDV